MDYKNYQTKKQAGSMEIVKAGGGFAIAQKRYNVETGELEAPEITSIDIAKLTERKQELQDEIAQINLLIADSKKL